MDRYNLIGKGLFPEVLPPCFEASDFKRALRGFTIPLRQRRFRKRSSELIAYNGTKHDGARRQFATPNPVQYFHVCDFIADYWSEIDQSIRSSPFVVSQPTVASNTADRPITIPSLSNLSNEASKRLSFSPIIVRADVSQLFASIYTHSISWAAYGREEAKKNQDPESKTYPFNALDRFVQGCQASETRGVAIGPDAFRIVAEFVIAQVDKKIAEKMGDRLVGAARHVDDFFIGVLEEADARYALSVARECLSDFRLQLNDAKTKITNGLEPLNEVWAQSLRRRSKKISLPFFSARKEDLALELINFACELAEKQGSESPIKIVLRAFDESHIYRSETRWKLIEPYMQRICFHHPHSMDYVSLLVVKRHASGGSIDSDGWSRCVRILVERNMALGHDHEVVWCIWLWLSLKIDMDEDFIHVLVEWHNQYVNCMLIWSYSKGWIKTKPKIRFGSKISTEGGRWLEGLVTRSTKFVKSKFSGAFAEEFEHLAGKGFQLVDLQRHLENMAPVAATAISKTRYGYDADDDSDFDIGSYRDELDEQLDEIMADPTS